MNQHALELEDLFDDNSVSSYTITNSLNLEGLGYTQRAFLQAPFAVPRGAWPQLALVVTAALSSSLPHTCEFTLQVIDLTEGCGPRNHVVGVVFVCAFFCVGDPSDMPWNYIAAHEERVGGPEKSCQEVLESAASTASPLRTPPNFMKRRRCGRGQHHSSRSPARSTVPNLRNTRLRHGGTGQKFALARGDGCAGDVEGPTDGAHRRVSAPSQERGSPVRPPQRQLAHTARSCVALSCWNILFVPLLVLSQALAGHRHNPGRNVASTSVSTCPRQCVQHEGYVQELCC